MESQEKVLKMQKTANTLYDLQDHTGVKFCKEIASALTEKSGGGEVTRISTENFSALVVSRFLTNHRFLEFMASKYGKDLQIVELGAGFTPHYLNLTSEIGKYVEIDFDDNSRIKEEVTRKYTDGDNIFFIAGDILSEDVWQKVKGIIDIKKPVIIFSEGVVAQYFNADQKKKISSFSKELLSAEGSCFVIDDTLRNHPELHSDPIIKEGMDRVAAESGSNVYKRESSTFEIESDRWSKLFGNAVYKVSYVMSKPEMDFAINSFNLLICINDPRRTLESSLEELSDQNKLNRIWK